MTKEKKTILSKKEEKEQQEQTEKSIELKIEGERLVKIMSQFLARLEAEKIMFKLAQKNEILRVRLEKDNNGKTKTITIFGSEGKIQEFIDKETLMKAAKNPNIINPEWMERELEDLENRLENEAEET